MACHDEAGMLSVEACRARLLGEVPVLHAPETVSLTDALGRLTARDIVAPLDVPPADNSAMDGYAIHFDDLNGASPLALVGQSLAGHPFAGRLEAGQCLRIMTGALVPDGAAAVVMQENARVEGAHVFLPGPIRPGENIRRRGEDIRRGETLLRTGHRLQAADIGLLASQGIAELSVQRRLRVALLSTGDELVAPGQPLGPGQIHDSNRAMLHAALTEAGFHVIDLGHVPDEREALRQRFQKADREADAIVTSGGVSVGDADLVRQVIGELGDIRVHKIAIKPGKPFAFGFLPGSVFFGLPGNPVSAFITLRQLALPALLHMQGGQWQPPLPIPAQLAAAVKKKPGRAEYQRGTLARHADGSLHVTPLPHQGSGVLTSVSRANCLILLAQEQGNLAAGDMVVTELL